MPHDCNSEHFEGHWFLGLAPLIKSWNAVLRYLLRDHEEHIVDCILFAKGSDDNTEVFSFDADLRPKQTKV
jgi:hypothetical protein